jgi:ribosomal protein L19E
MREDIIELVENLAVVDQKDSAMVEFDRSRGKRRSQYGHRAGSGRRCDAVTIRFVFGSLLAQYLHE